MCIVSVGLVNCIALGIIWAFINISSQNDLF